MSRIRANQITNKTASGAPTVQNGLVVTGVTTSTNVSVASSVTASTFHGNGAGLTNVSAGKVLQVVQQYDTTFTRTANATSSYAPTTHQVSITPTVANSKILVNISGACNNNGAGNVIYMDIYRSVNGGTFDTISPNGTSVPTAGFTLNKGDQSRNEIPMNIMYLDTPTYSVGNAIIYKLYIRNNGSGSVEVPSNPGGEPVICIAQEISA